MNYKRALGFAALLYFLTLFIGWGVGLLMGLEQTLTEIPWSMWIAGWVINVVLILALGKWFFKKVEPTAKNGLILGVITVVFGLVFDGLSIWGAVSSGQDTGIFVAMYSDWRFYLTVLEVLVLTTFAGFEFDSTYSAPKE